MDVDESNCNNNLNNGSNNNVGYIFNNRLVTELNKINQISGRVYTIFCFDFRKQDYLF